MTLRQRHLAGEKTFLDWAGKTLRWTNPESGDDQPAFLFVAVLGASDYVFAEAFADQKLDAWIEAHIPHGGILWRRHPALGPRQRQDRRGQTVLLRAADTRQLSRVGRSLRHGDPADAHTRSKRQSPRWKMPSYMPSAASLARLRDQTFFTLGAINVSIRHCLKELNERPFQKMAGSRLELYNELDQPALRPLPSHRYQLGEWKQAKANIDYHVQADWHYYSVPYQLTQQPIEVRLSARTVELFHKGRRVAAHPRSRVKGGFTTDPAHRPKAHEKHLDWSPGRLIDWAGTVGVQCAPGRGPHPR